MSSIEELLQEQKRIAEKSFQHNRVCNDHNEDRCEVCRQIGETIEANHDQIFIYRRDASSSLSIAKINALSQSRELYKYVLNHENLTPLSEEDNESGRRVFENWKTAHKNLFRAEEDCRK